MAGGPIIIIMSLALPVEQRKLGPTRAQPWSADHMVGRAWASPNVAHPRCMASLTHAKPKPMRDDGVREDKKEFLYLSPSLPENLKPYRLHLDPIYSPKLPLIPAASHHLQPMAGEGNPKTVATTPAATHPAINAPNFATEAMLEDEATFV